MYFFTSKKKALTKKKTATGADDKAWKAKDSKGKAKGDPIRE